MERAHKEGSPKRERVTETGGPPCDEAQADGVPCEELDRDCEECEHANPVRRSDSAHRD